MLYPKKRTVRVVVGQLGDIVCMTVSDLDIFVERDTREDAWRKFLEQARIRDDAAWLRFDVGPTRREEIEKGLDIPEDEDWLVLFGRPKD